MKVRTRQVVLIIAVGVLVPIMFGVGLGFFSETVSDSVAKNWTVGVMWIIGVFAGSIPLFFLELRLLRKALAVLGYLVFSFAVFAYSGLGVVCGVYDNCF